MHAYLNPLISSDVRSYRLRSSPAVSGVSWGSGIECAKERLDEEVAMTRKVVRSKRITSVALQAAANVERCFVRIAALGIRVCTTFDHA